MRTIAAMSLLFACGCSHYALHESFGATYNAMFAAQSADRQSREVPLRGEEARRIISGYYESVGGADGAGGTPTPSVPAGRGPGLSQQSPFAIRAH